nr:DIM1 family protein [Cryptomonas curvata]
MITKEMFDLKLNYIISEYSNDQLILDEEKRILCINFEVDFNFLFLNIYKKIFHNKKLVITHIIFYSLNTQAIKGYNQMYELFDSSSIIFFYKNKRLLIDNNSGNNNKIENFLRNSQCFHNFCQNIVLKVKKGKNAIFLF